MSFDQMGRGGLAYFPCRYGASRMMFRGPARALDGEYVVCLGGAETYGKFIPEPFAARVEACLGLPVVNLGWANAGVDAFLGDGDLLQVVAGARAVVMQVLGAQNQSNRFYAVHPRHNDRFLQATPAMRRLFPEVDFTEFHFTRHLLHTLNAVSAVRFAEVCADLQAEWGDRMRHLLARIPAPVVLLWLADQPPGAAPPGLGQEPMLVTGAMLEALRAHVAGIVTAVPGAAALAQGTQGMVFSAMEAQMAAQGLPVAAHDMAAEALIPSLRALLASSEKARHC